MAQKKKRPTPSPKRDREDNLVTRDTLKAGDRYRDRRGNFFRVESTEVVAEGEFGENRKWRQKIKLRIFDEQLNRSYDVQAMGDDVLELAPE